MKEVEIFLEGKSDSSADEEDTKTNEGDDEQDVIDVKAQVVFLTYHNQSQHEDIKGVL